MLPITPTSDLVSWDVVALESNRQYRLTVRHEHGEIVEYFSALPVALDRAEELQRLLLAVAHSGATIPPNLKSCT